ncbi:MAG: hypothetical protein IJI25_12030 [Eubacterium sp.]|nr:hypothetical protein [Eubacterium sp.]
MTLKQSLQAELQPARSFPPFVTMDSIFTEGMSQSSFLCLVDGNGMEGAGIYHNDWLIFDPDAQPEDGEIVCLEVFGQRLIRRVFFIKDDGGSLLQLCIRREDTITPDLKADAEDVRILGVFSGLIRNCRKSKKTRSPHYQYFSPEETEEKIKKERTAGQGRKDKGSVPAQEKDGHLDSSASITKLGLPTRIMNCFLNIGMHTAEDLLAVPDKEAMLAIPGIGKGAYEKVLANLEGHGFDIRHLRW